MRWMTYNIRRGTQCGPDAVIDVIRECRPDVVGLQEIGSNWREPPAGHVPARIAQQTGLDHYVFVPTLTKSMVTRYGHALLSRWPIRVHDIVPLSCRIDEPRKVLSATIIGPDQRLRVLATHLSYKERDRKLQGPELLEIIDRQPEEARPLVVLGDLNEPLEGETPFRDSSSGWFDSLTERFDPAARLAPDPTFENPTPDQRIDYLLVEGDRWDSAFVPDKPDISDHQPVVADL